MIILRRELHRRGNGDRIPSYHFSIKFSQFCSNIMSIMWIIIAFLFSYLSFPKLSIVINKLIENSSIATYKDSDKVYYVILPRGRLKKYWEIFGSFLLLLNIICQALIFFHSSSSNPHDRSKELRSQNLAKASNNLTDLYFLIDFAMQFRTAYYNNEGEIVLDPDRIFSNYVGSWLAFDLILLFPYGTIYNAWKARPMSKLLDIRNSPRPILNFILRRDFRLNLIATYKAHRSERVWICNLLGICNRKLSFVSRCAKLLLGFSRALKRLSLLSLWSKFLMLIMTVMTSLRTLSVLASVAGSRMFISITPKVSTSPK